MSDFSSNSRRMAKNTLLMYIRMLVLVVVQLYTVPIVLQSLGVEDYGIYNVVGGFVAMFTFINGSLVSGCQRFMAYAIGQKDEISLKQVFDTSVFVFVTLALVLFVLLEGIGIWFLNTQMNIPTYRISAANWVLQFSVLSLLFNICLTPFNAIVIAHEKMSIYARVSILESLYKLAIAICISFVSSDKIIIYSVLMFSSSLLANGIYFFYSKKKYKETISIKIKLNKVILKEITSYAGWNLIGSVALILRNHGLNIIMNLFFNPVMNAAHTIATHINGLFNQFVNNVYMATRPQMVKQFAAGNVDGMWEITFRSSKYAFFLMVYIAVPALIEVETFLRLWLRDVPDFTADFSRLMILSLLVETVTNQIIGAFQAENKIKSYQTVSSVVLLSVIPLSYAVLKLSLNPILPYLVFFLVSCIYACSIIIVAINKLQLCFSIYLREVLLKDVVVFFVSLVLTYFFVSDLESGFLRVIETVIISLIISTLTMFVFGIDKSEKKIIIKMFHHGPRNIR